MNYKAYDEGRYAAVVKDYGWTEASTGTPEWYLAFELEGKYGEAGRVLPCPRFERTFFRPISRDPEKRPACVRMLQDDLDALGVTVADEAQLDRHAPNAVDLLGRKIDVFMTQEQYQGKVVERWSLRPRSRAKLSLPSLRSRLGGPLFAEPNATPPPAVPPAEGENII